MAKNLVFRKDEVGGDVSINLTPMIDVTFQLIIFFIIVGQIASDELAQLILPRPYQSQVITEEEGLRQPNRVIVNVVSAEKKDNDDPLTAGEAREYKVSGKRINLKYPNAYEDLVDAIKARYIASEKPNEFVVEIRADERVAYLAVEPIMRAAGGVGISKMNLTAEVWTPPEE